MTLGKALPLLLLILVVAHGVVGEGTREPSNRSRQLLQNQAYVWARDTAAISAARDVVQNLILSGNGPADGIKAAARGLEIARLASNKAVNPWEFDRAAPPAVNKPSRNPVGRRLLQQQ